jgi:hypothetical protein
MWKVCAAVVACALTACVGPARSFDTFQAKAAQTAGAVLSSVQSARTAAQLSSTRKAPDPYLSVVISNAEEDAGSAISSFETIQPPDHASDQLRARAESLFSRAVSAISQMRIAARREDAGAVQRLGDSLGQLTEPLQSISNLSG